MAVTGSLGQIRTKVRKIAGMPSVNQLSNDDLDNYINDFYQYDLPEHLRLWNLHGSYSVTLTPHQPLYIFPFNTYTNLEPPCYVDGTQIPLFQSTEAFFKYAPSQHNTSTLSTGTGVAGPYTGTLTNTPITRGTLDITVTDVGGNTLVANDSMGIWPAGTLTGNVTGGVINYSTGAITALTWNAVIPAGNIMTAHYISWPEGKPTAVLFDANVIEFYPVPDIAYEFACAGFENPDALNHEDQQVQVRDWWSLVAYGTALKIFADNLDMESYQKADVFFQRQMLLVERRTLVQIKNQRVSTIYNSGILGDSYYNSNIGS